MARTFTHKTWTDSINNVLSNQVFTLKQTHQINDEIIMFLRTKNKRLDTINTNNEGIIKHLNTHIVVQDKKIKRSQFHNIILGAGLLILSTHLITN